jgi:hypothetical protein
MKDEDGVALIEGDFRTKRVYLAPHVFFWGDEEVTEYPPPTDLVPRKVWEGLMDLPTDVALRSTSWHGSAVSRLHQLQCDWIHSWPGYDDAAFMNEPTLIAGEEFDALVFNAMHGWYRQAIGCLRNSLEVLTIAAALAVRNDTDSYSKWRSGYKSYKFGNAREMLRDSEVGGKIDGEVSPNHIFGDTQSDWMKDRYSKICAYSHGQAGHDNGAIWHSNGPVFVNGALEIVESEFRETLALCYLLMRIGWTGYVPGPGVSALLDAPQSGWQQYDAVLRKWLLP